LPGRSPHPILATPWFVDKHDLAVAKLLAGRKKDHDFVGALLDNGLLEKTVLTQRLGDLPPEAHPTATQRTDMAPRSDQRVALRHPA